MFLNIFKKNKIFILGCQRSGTTLLRLILDSHKKIHCYGETTGYAYFEKNIKLRHKKKFEAFQLPIWTELFVEYECIRNYRSNNDKILFIFRDPKEVISSMKCLKINNKNYIEYEVSKNIKDWMNDKSRSFKKDFDKEIKDDPIAKAICYWKYKNNAFFKMKNLNWNIKLINYKNLVENPKNTIEEILKFLNIKWDNNVLHHHKIQHNEVFQNNLTLGNTKADRPIDQISLNKWQKTLSKKEIEIIEEKTKEMKEKLNNNV